MIAFPVIGTTIVITYEGIAYFTPSQVYRGEHLQIQRIRQHALDRFWKEHPQSDLFVDDHWRHHFPTKSGSIDRNHQNRFLPNS